MTPAQSILTALKYGRVLSAANEREITAAVSALVSVLARAGIEIGNDMNEKQVEDKLKQLDPDTAQQIVEIVNEFVGQLDAQLGITEAVQGEQPPPEEGDENPDEEQPVDEDGNPVEDKPDPNMRDEDMPDEDDMHEGNPRKKKPPYGKSKMGMRPMQEEVNYTPDYIGDEHCASCRWFMASGHEGMAAPYCHLIENWPADILATGHCDRHEAIPSFEPKPLEVTIVGAASLNDIPTGATVAYTENASDRKPVWKIIKDGALKMLGSQPTPLPSDNSSFQVFKGANGMYYWLARHTNMFEDRDQEIISRKAHERYIARVELGLVDPPELWMWHTKGSRHGQADVVWQHAGFVFALGHFDDTPEGKRAVKFYQRHQGRIELSHGFTYPSWALKDGVYETYNTFEISTLPPGAAANPYTRFEEIEIMALSDKQRQFIADGLGQEMVERIERAQAAAESDAKSLIAQDKRYKDFADTVVDDGTDQVKIDLKALLKLNAELIEAQGVLDADNQAQKAARESVESELKTMRDQLTALKAQLDARPRSATRADETKIESKSLPKEVQDSLYVDDPIWGKLKPE